MKQNSDKLMDVYGKTRETVYMDGCTKKHIKSLADEKRWPWSYMAYVLLKRAVAESLRKRGVKNEEDCS
jgi:hypothetical protein